MNEKNYEKKMKFGNVVVLRKHKKKNIKINKKKLFKNFLFFFSRNKKHTNTHTHT